jgi:hypothetical protein
MGKLISLNEFAIRKEQKRIKTEEEEYNKLAKMVEAIIEQHSPQDPDMPILWDDQEAQEYLTASNLDIAIMKLMDVVVLLDSCNKIEESKLVNKIAGKLLGIEEI